VKSRRDTVLCFKTGYAKNYTCDTSIICRGHDFRPDYAKLHVLRVVFPTVPLLLLTATANSDVRQDVITMYVLSVILLLVYFMTDSLSGYN
jgi:hypothetical protein